PPRSPLLPYTTLFRSLVLIYTVAAGYAGAAGALLAQTTQFVSLDVLAFHRSAEALLMLVIGGSGMLYGALVGALSFKVLQDLFSDRKSTRLNSSHVKI